MTDVPAKRPGTPANITVNVNGKTVGQLKVPFTVAFGFTANDALDIGTDLGSPVSPDYYDKAPFKFNGKITSVNIKYTQ